jgi:hypothetical protein
LLTSLGLSSEITLGRSFGGMHSRWSGQPGRAFAIRDFIEYALGQDGVRFMRRIDVAEFWGKTFPPEAEPTARSAHM